MEGLGRHILVEMYDCNSDIINDKKKVKEIMLEAARLSKVTVIDAIFHKFNPHGISGVIVIAESHLTIHTWPEYKYAALDFFTCGNQMEPLIGQNYVINEFKCKVATTLELKRGTIKENNNIGKKSLNDSTVKQLSFNANTLR